MIYLLWKKYMHWLDFIDSRCFLVSQNLFVHLLDQWFPIYFADYPKPLCIYALCVMYKLKILKQEHFIHCFDLGHIRPIWVEIIMHSTAVHYKNSSNCSINFAANDFCQHKISWVQFSERASHTSRIGSFAIATQQMSVTLGGLWLS